MPESARVLSSSRPASVLWFESIMTCFGKACVGGAVAAPNEVLEVMEDDREGADEAFNEDTVSAPICPGC